MAAVVLLVLLAPTFEDLKQAYEQAVADNQWKTVRSVTREIAAKKSTQAARFLRRELDMAVEPVHRHAVFHALAFMRFQGDRDFLNEHLGSEDPYYRATALQATARLDPDKARGRAGDLLQVDDDRRVRRVAAELLAGMKSAEAARALAVGAAELPSDEQAAAVALLRRLETDTLQSLRDLAADGDPEVRLVALLVLSVRGETAWRPLFEQARKDQDRRVALVAEAALDRLGKPGQASRVRAALKRVKKPGDRWEVYDLIARGGLRDPVLVDALARAAKTGDKRLRAKAAESLGRIGGAGAVPHLKPLLAASKPWQLPIGAARGLAATRAREAVAPLIAALPKATGRLSREIAAALESLTGQPFGRNATVWKRWWSERGTGFQVPEIAPALWEEETAAGDNYAFYGIELVSEAAVFVCDVSGSMQGDRLQSLKRELGIVIRRFPPQGRFNLVFFNDKVAAWSKKLVKVSDKARAKALQLVESLQAVGATNIWDALQKALEDPAVDTVVLLTDGAPTAGKVRNVNEIRDRFLKQNQERMVMLHVVSIGQSAPYLRDMARLSGGNYVER